MHLAVQRTVLLTLVHSFSNAYHVLVASCRVIFVQAIVEYDFFVAPFSVLSSFFTISCTVRKPTTSITFAESSIRAGGIRFRLAFGQSFAMQSIKSAVRQLHIINRFFYESLAVWLQ